MAGSGGSGSVARLAIVAIVVGGVAATFVYLRGWLTPHELTPAKFADRFEEVGGVHQGFRRNHAKGLGASGYFESNGNGAKLSKAAVFQAGKYNVIGRFSLSGGNPFQADVGQTVRGLGLEFDAPNGELWRTAMVNIPVFVVRTPQAFFEQLLAFKPDPKTGKPDPAAVKQFLDQHPETAAALKIVTSKAPTSGFADSEFRGLNAFRMTNAEGKTVAVRWALVPEHPPAAIEHGDAKDKNYLFDDVIKQVHGQPLRWHLILTVAKPEDPTNDATLPWPADREQVDVGTVTLDHVYAEADSPSTDINFDPLVLPAGIAPSDDPILSARSAVYSQSFTRREGETKQPAAISPEDVQKGK